MLEAQAEMVTEAVELKNTQDRLARLNDAYTSSSYIEQKAAEGEINLIVAELGLGHRFLPPVDERNTRNMQVAAGKAIKHLEKKCEKSLDIISRTRIPVVIGSDGTKSLEVDEKGRPKAKVYDKGEDITNSVPIPRRDKRSYERKAKREYAKAVRILHSAVDSLKAAERFA